MIMRLFLFVTLTFLSRAATGQDVTQSNQHFWHQLSTAAPATTVWEIWTDVGSWKDWDSGLKDASIVGDFQLGNKGTIISLEGRKSRFKIVELVPGKSYTIKTRLPLGSLYVKRFLEEKNGQVEFTHEVWFSGLTKGVFAKAFGGNFRQLLPQVMAEIKTIAESKQQ